MSHWSTLVNTALLGTQRAVLPPNQEVTPLGAVLQQVSTKEPAHDLLSAAGALNLHEQVGWLPGQMAEYEPFKSLRDERPVCSPQVQRHLLVMLDGHFRSLLPELLAAIHKAGLRLPTLILPNLINHGARFAATRAAILPVLGESGRWLAAQNPAWHYASSALDSWDGAHELWERLAILQRLGLLRQLRHMNSGNGRSLVAATWKSTNDGDRFRAIKLFGNGLSMEDEPFLEMALDDRSYLIRKEAISLLAHLPQSRLCQRMTANSKGWLTWTPTQEQKIRIRFPKISPQMARDGVVMQGHKELARLRAQQLIALVAAIPLTHWTESWRATPEEIMRAIPTTNWKRTLTTAVTTAAYRQHDSEWAFTILTTHGFDVRTKKLIGLLSATQADQLIDHVVGQMETQELLRKNNPLLAILRHYPHEWEQDQARFLLNYVAWHIRQDGEAKYTDAMIRPQLRLLARAVPTKMLTEATQILDVATQAIPVWRPMIDEMLKTIRFRTTMLEGIS